MKSGSASISDFMRETSADGLGKIASARHGFTKALWTLLCIGKPKILNRFVARSRVTDPKRPQFVCQEWQHGLTLIATALLKCFASKIIPNSL